MARQSMWWWVCALVVGCSMEVDDADVPPTEFRVLDPDVEEVVCDARRQIARLKPNVQGCPSVASWTKSRFFTSGTP